MHGLLEAFEEGGWGMWPILLLLIITIVITVERALYITKSKVNVDKLMSLLKSQIVAGNVREAGVRLVAEKGPFEIRGEPAVAKALDRLLRGFVAEHRMKLSDPQGYQPCFRVVA